MEVHDVFKDLLGPRLVLAVVSPIEIFYSPFTLTSQAKKGIEAVLF